MPCVPHRRPLIGLLAAAVALLTACGTHRGLPSHGGGKRFDEEQRAVSASIRQAVVGMDLAPLVGKRVHVAVAGIAHSGGGRESFPGVTTGNLGLSGNDSSNATTGLSPAGAGAAPGWIPSWRNVGENASRTANAGVSLRFEHDYDSYQTWTDADLAYLDQVVRMRLLHLGIVPADRDTEARLTVLVDVLGTNRNRSDWILARTDRLQASCELTYYAVGDKNDMVLAARRSGARSEYSERGILLVSGITPRRSTATGCLGDLAMP